MLKSYFSLGRDFVVRRKKRRRARGDEEGRTEGKEERRKKNFLFHLEIFHNPREIRS